VKRRWVLVGCALVLSVALAAVATQAATTLFGTRFNVGEEIQFKVEDSTTWWWGCCCPCEDTSILGWRITNLSGIVVYSVIHDAPVAASVWLGAWNQTDINGTAVGAGQYMLVVDTTAGTLSRCFSIYDPCGCGPCTTCYSCACEQVSSISSCACKTSLVFVDTCTNCFPFFFGLFGCCSSPCTSGCP
jgi:hypothetical protein